MNNIQFVSHNQKIIDLTYISGEYTEEDIKMDIYFEVSKYVAKTIAHAQNILNIVKELAVEPEISFRYQEFLFEITLSYTNRT